jgi:hypothetical protein
MLLRGCEAIEIARARFSTKFSPAAWESHEDEVRDYRCMRLLRLASVDEVMSLRIKA